MDTEEVREMIRNMSWEELLIFLEIVGRLSQQNKRREQSLAGREDE